ncbi:MAG: O-antigen ligase family protein, partial [Planctomycetales bacterium]|nr:O-antigen ligase family protein [Planctomycetales bacterium]
MTNELAESASGMETTATSQTATDDVPRNELDEKPSVVGGDVVVGENESDWNAETDAERRATLEEVGSRTLSIDPLQTRATVCVFAMGLAVLLSSIILFRDRQSVSLLLGTLVLSGLAIALLGIYQAVVAGDWTLINVPKQTSFATFYSRNSAPQFLACCFAATAGMLGLHRANKSKLNFDKRYRVVYPSVNMVARLRRRVEEFITEANPMSFGLLLVMVLLFASVLIANSRGGTLAFFASGLAVLLIYALGKQASFSSIIAVVFLVVGSGLFLSLYGLDELVGARMDTVSREAYQMDNARLELWKMALSQPSAWLLGSGLGTFHFA